MAAVLAAFAVPAAPPAFAQAKPPVQVQAQPQPAQIDRNGVLILLRSTLLTLHAANETGNYTVLRDLGAPSFQQANSAARLGEVFAALRAQKLDLSGVAVLDPQLTLLPQIEADGSMRFAGFFPSAPLQINFELLFTPVNGFWRLQGVSVGLANSSPVAPPAAVAEPAKPEPPAAKPAARPETKPAPKRSEPKPQAPRPAAPAQPAQPDQRP